ncbi:MAG: FKBP-type peptidyl-prolyl cis-trans isomerase [Polyangia bacterium]
MVVEEGKIVTLEYMITTQKGEQIESSVGRGEPLVFLFGKSGMLPGLDEALRGMEKGEEKEFDLPPEKAFGTMDSGPTMEIPKSRLPEDAETRVGSMFQADMPGTNQTVNFSVLEDRVNDIKVRLIHPLAGKVIHIKAKVLDVRDATSEEMQG